MFRAFIIFLCVGAIVALFVGGYWRGENNNTEQQSATWEDINAKKWSKIIESEPATSTATIPITAPNDYLAN